MKQQAGPRVWTIYLVTSLVNGKRYVGQTCKRPAKRWSDHKDEARFGRKGRGSSAFHAAMRKHGVENFRFVIIETCGSKTRADDLERRWIRVCHSRAHEHGYNLTAGGEGNVDWHPSDETRKRQSISASAAMTPERRESIRGFMRGHKWTSERRANHRPPAPRLPVAKIAEAYANGETVTTIAKRFGTHASTVSHIGHQHGSAHRHVRRTAFTETERQELLHLYELGHKTEDIALFFDTNLTTISRTVKALGGEVRKVGAPRVRLSDEQKREMLSLYGKVPTSELIERFGISAASLSRLWKESGGANMRPRRKDKV